MKRTVQISLCFSRQTESSVFSLHLVMCKFANFTITIAKIKINEQRVCAQKRRMCATWPPIYCSDCYCLYTQQSNLCVYCETVHKTDLWLENHKDTVLRLSSAVPSTLSTDPLGFLLRFPWLSSVVPSA